MKTAFVYKRIYRLILWASVVYFLTTTAGRFFALSLVVALFYFVARLVFALAWRQKGVVAFFDTITFDGCERVERHLPEEFLTVCRELGYTVGAVSRKGILAQADEVVTLQDGYTEGCFLRRNDYLLENSAFLMVYYDSVAVGGTFYTLKRAVEQKKKFANVCYNRR